MTEAKVVVESIKKFNILHNWRPLVFSLGFAAGFAVAFGFSWLKTKSPSENAQQAVLPNSQRTLLRPRVSNLQTQVQSEVDNLPSAQLTQSMGDLAPYFTLAQLASRVRQRIETEAIAEANLNRAKELAIQGISARDAGREDGNETLEELQHQEYLWESAIRQLDQIPKDSIFVGLAADKREEYGAILNPVAEDIDNLQSGFLTEIAEKTGRPHAIRITICHLSGECRDYKGDIPPESPASLIKVPVAVVLMHKVTKEGIDLSDPIYIDPHNWTENANGAKIYVDHEYPLREVMVRMIKESNNIATNQLIDYIGWDYLDNTLKEMGYTTTKVRSKLIGDHTAPTHNRRVGSNVMTSNEVTEMMRQIYTFTNPGDEEILDGMVGQYDWEFGYMAARQLKSKRVAWIGEKTGQNSNVIGSSMAVKIDDERYVMTVTIDNSANQKMLRQVIGDTIQAILDGGHLVRTSR